MQLVIVINLGLPVTALDAGVECTGCIGRYLGAKKIERHREMKIYFLLDQGQIDDAMAADIFNITGIANRLRLHFLASPLNDSLHPGAPYKHVVPFFGEHKTASARQGIEA